MHCVVISLQATIQPRYVWLIYMTRSFFCRGAWILEPYWSISWLTMSIYTLCTIWLFNSSPWKTIIFKNGKPSISMGRLYHGYVSHNHRVVWLILQCCPVDLQMVVVLGHLTWPHGQDSIKGYWPVDWTGLGAQSESPQKIDKLCWILIYDNLLLNMLLLSFGNDMSPL